MDMVEKSRDFFKSNKNILVLMWKKECGWELLTPQCELIADIGSTDMNPERIKELVIDDDQSLYQTFAERIEKEIQGVKMESIPDEGRHHMTCRMKKPQGGIGYYKIGCWFERTNESIDELMFMIHELDQAETYRVRLSQKFTTDRDPSIFHEQGKELILANPDKTYAVVQFDVVKFKVINEVYGEKMGDEILRFFTESLKRICGKERLFARITSDVYMIITPYKTVEDINQLIELLDETLLGYRNINYTIVYGVSFVTDLSVGMRKYGDAAAVARQGIKGDALHHVAFFDEQMIEGIQTKKFLEDNMKTALKNREFVMFLQPKYSISQNEMVGAEALVRWIHPEKGMISPMEFVPLFEKNGFVIKMDQYIWEEACRTIREWIDEGLTPLPISVNVSRRHLRDLEFVSVLNRLVETYEIPKEYLEIEITETVEEEVVGSGISLLKESGFKLLMDDFGSGFSSLNMLKDTKFDVIKMDQGFLRDFIGSERGKRIVEHTIQMSKDIGLDMVAEGVETKEQAMFLKECGCDTAQGYYYAKPMALEEFNKLLRKEQNR